MWLAFQCLRRRPGTKSERKHIHRTTNIFEEKKKKLFLGGQDCHANDLFSQWNICVFTKDSFGMADGAKDPILFTINDAILKNASGSHLDGADLSTARVKTAIIDALNQILLPDFVREPSPGVFTSRASKSYFKDDFPMHVNGHLGTKEGLEQEASNALFRGGGKGTEEHANSITRFPFFPQGCGCLGIQEAFILLPIRHN